MAAIPHIGTQEAQGSASAQTSYQAGDDREAPAAQRKTANGIHYVSTTAQDNCVADLWCADSMNVALGQQRRSWPAGAQTASSPPPSKVTVMDCTRLCRHQESIRSFTASAVRFKLARTSYACLSAIRRPVLCLITLQRSCADTEKLASVASKACAIQRCPKQWCDSCHQSQCTNSGTTIDDMSSNV